MLFIGKGMTRMTCEKASLQRGETAGATEEGNAEKTARKLNAAPRLISPLNPPPPPPQHYFPPSHPSPPIVDSVFRFAQLKRGPVSKTNLSLRRRVSLHCNYVLMRCVIVMLMKALVGKC